MRNERPGRPASAGIPLTAMARGAIVCLALSAVIPTPVAAMDIEPRITAHGIYSDNISLDGPGLETESWVGMLEPGIKITHASSRVALDVDYRAQFIWYEEPDGADQTLHLGKAGLDLELLQDRFFLESFYDRSQIQIDPEQPISSTNIPFIINRTDRSLIQTAPHWRSPVFGQILDVRYTVGRFDYDDPLTQDTKFQVADTSLASPEADTGLGWRLNHRYLRFEYDTPPDSKAQELVLTLDYALNPEFSLVGSYGRESEFGNYTSSKLDDAIWSAGFESSGTRTDLSASVGERSFGRTFSLSLVRRIGRNGEFTATFSQAPRTSESAYRERTINRDSELTNAPLLPTVPSDIDRPGTGFVYVERFAQAGFSRAFNRNTLTLLVYYEKQSDFQARGTNPTIPGNQSQLGTILRWAMVLGPKTQLDTELTWVDRSFAGNDDIDDTYGGIMRLRRELGRRTSLEGYYRRSERTGAVNRAFDYTENQVGISVTRSF